MCINIRDLSEVHCNYFHQSVCFISKSPVTKYSTFVFLKSFKSIFAEHNEHKEEERDVIIKHNFCRGSVYWMVPFRSNAFLHLGVYSQISSI